MIRNAWVLGALLALALSSGLGLAPAAAQGTAYCYLRELDIVTPSNGVQIAVKADGMLNWSWEGDSGRASSGQPVSRVSLRFTNARLGLEKNMYMVEKTPVSTLAFTVPQDAREGLGVVMTVTMSEPSRVEASLSPDRQTFLLTVYGTRTVESSSRTGGPTVKEGGLQVTERNGLLTVLAVKANIQQVVAEVARLGNLNAAVDDAVQHQVSINLVDRPALDIIKSIAAGYGLALSSVSDVYMLSEGVPTDLPSYRCSGTASFAMRYLKAGDARTLLPTFLFKYVHDNPEQNAVVVTAPSQMLDKIGRDLNAIDLPPPMIMVECAVVELTDSDDLDRGFRWRYSGPEHVGEADSNTGKVEYHQVDLSNGLATALASTTTLQAWLSALITEGRAEVRAHPSMAAVNGKDASIFIGSQRYIKVQYLQYGQMQERIQTVPVGVRLSVRPWTGGNGEVSTYLQVEVSNIVRLDPETGVPLLGTRRASTTMRTRDGETIVIGGLTQQQDEVTKRRIPFLGDLPLIGELFRSRTVHQSDSELVILVRPRLLDDSGRLPADEDTATRTRLLLPGDLGYPDPAPTP